ncbi:deaminase domain-containing protein [Rossellomorea aquimaris]|uniref:deaminase domain-containing protein n=1 Tax=Rossellomorea aquimaris TaxID=189382 RepID=UPI0005CA86EA|nr:deaminase domain-containing protein [Rossellomorea aquimaris]
MNVQEYNQNDLVINEIINEYNLRLQKLSEDQNINEDDRFNYARAINGGNFACAYYITNNEAKKYIAHSGFNRKDKFKYLDIFKDKYIIGYRPELIGRTNAFKTKVLNDICSESSENWNRWDDTESKILEQISFENTEEFNHSIILWTKRYPCPSCRCVIIEFEKKYNVDITVYYEKRYNNNPCDKGGGCDDN